MQKEGNSGSKSHWSHLSLETDKYRGTNVPRYHGTLGWLAGRLAGWVRTTGGFAYLTTLTKLRPVASRRCAARQESATFARHVPTLSIHKPPPHAPVAIVNHQRRLGHYRRGPSLVYSRPSAAFTSEQTIACIACKERAQDGRPQLQHPREDGPSPPNPSLASCRRRRCADLTSSPPASSSAPRQHLSIPRENPSLPARPWHYAMGTEHAGERAQDCA